MLTEIKAMLRRSDTTLFLDFVGVVALMVTLVAGLHLPGGF
ncbi:hypothetical protein CLV78_101761 [Aliiruegeria haliotis]|uniref:Uncharacterized protein n=1 Tax=Aliiruegeria haliotis TaxID=1280846 RepID=A0A2T0RZT2_9RHOB|nr:hypothetical protein [Aliiruegeria haliotis]PRY26660.1 hypothetical protein CLV78_101761 [Aliiruegeria haliotis]